MAKASRIRRRLAGLLPAAAAAAVMLVVCSVGIRWGLPSERRNKLYFRTEQSLAIRRRASEESDTAEAWKRWGPYAERFAHEQDEKLPRSYYNALRSYHPDEYAVLKVLANISPSEGRLDPRFYHLGGAFIYPYGMILFALGKAGVIKVVADPAYYLDRPDEIAAFYLAGRILCALFAAGTVLVVCDLGRRLHSKMLGLASGLALCVLPAFALNAHFLYVDVPAAFWATLCLWALVVFLDGRKGGMLLLAAVAAGLAVGTKVSTGPLVGLVVLTAALARGRNPARRAMLALAAIGGSAGAFAASNPFAVRNFVTFAGDVRSNAFVNPAISPYVAILSKSVNPVFAALVVVGVVISLVALRRNAKLAVIAGWAVLLFFAACLFGKRYARYLAPMLPAAAVLGALPAAALYKAGRRVAGYAVFLLPFLYNVVWTVSLLVALARPDTRTVAGELLRQECALGTRIAVTEVPWQYEMPAFDELAYDTAVVGYDPERLIDARAEVFITSEPQRVRSLRDEARAAAFWNAFDALVEEGEYTLLGRVENPQSVAGVRLGTGTFPEDLRYHNPVISIYARKGE